MTRTLERLENIVAPEQGRLGIPSIGLVYDNPIEAAFRRTLLQEAGYQVHSNSIDNAFEVISGEPIDLLIIDAQRKPAQAMEVVKTVREFSSLPIIVIGEDDEDYLFEISEDGADMYVVRDMLFDSELPARVKALLRSTNTNGKEVKPTIFNNGGLEINFSQHRVTVDGEEISLTPTEYKLLTLLARNVGRTLLSGRIFSNMRSQWQETETHLIYTHIARLREKLGENSKQPRFVHTRSHFGYVMPNLNQPETTKINGTITTNPAPILPRSEE